MCACVCVTTENSQNSTDMAALRDGAVTGPTVGQPPRDLRKADTKEWRWRQYGPSSTYKQTLYILKGISIPIYQSSYKER